MIPYVRDIYSPGARAYVAYAFVCSLVLTFLLNPVVRKLGLVDRPGGHKIHNTVVPLSGGIAVFCVVAGALFVSGRLGNCTMQAMICGGALLLVVGIADDIKPLSSVLRLCVQATVALLAMRAGSRITILPDGVGYEIVECVLTMLWIVGLTNAMNFMDGLDGLVGGMTAISAVFLGMLMRSPQNIMLPFIYALVGGLAGFLVFNFRGKTFLGDGGSTMLGYWLAVIALNGQWSVANPLTSALVPVVILSIPIFDLCHTTLTRIGFKQVRNMLQWFDYTGHDHFHHRILRLGFSPFVTTLTVYSLTLLMGISGFLMWHDDGKGVVTVLVIAQLLLVYLVISLVMWPAAPLFKKRGSCEGGSGCGGNKGIDTARQSLGSVAGASACNDD